MMKVFVKLQVEQIVRIKLEAVSLDSISIKVHPDGTGALKKRATVHRQKPGRMEHQGAYGCRGCSNGHSVRPVAGQCARRSRRTRVAVGTAEDAGKAAHADGSSL